MHFCKKLAAILLCLSMLTCLFSCVAQTNELHSALKKELCATDWTSGSVYWKKNNESGYVRWLYTFHEDGTGTRLDEHQYKGDTDWEKQGPYDITYKFVTVGNQLYLRIDTGISKNDYLLDYNAETGAITGFTGLVQFRDDYTATFHSNQAAAQ